MEGQKPLRIVKFEAEHVKRIKAITIEPSPEKNVVLLTGKNRQGKTSVLDSIWCALGGKSAIPSRPVQDGEDSGYVSIDLGEFVVTRSFYGDGKSSLTIKNKEGYKMTSPQTFLSSKLGEYARDPMAFMRLKEDEQVRYLQSIVDINLDPGRLAEVSGLSAKDLHSLKSEDPIAVIDSAHKAVYESRAGVNRDVARVAGVVKTLKAEIPDWESIDSHPVRAKELFEARKVLEEQDAKRRLISSQIEAGNKHLAETLPRKIKDVSERISDLMAKLELAKGELKSLETETSKTEGMIQEMIAQRDRMPIPDFSEIDARIATADEHNRKAESIRTLKVALKELEEAQTQSEKLSEKLASIKNYRTELIQSAGLPVPGLGFQDGVVTYNGLPLSQASGREQIEVSCAVCFAQNPQIGVLTIDSGWSQLDSDGKEVLKAWAQKQGAQIWLTDVRDAPEAEGFHILDGAVVAIDGHLLDAENPMTEVA